MGRGMLGKVEAMCVAIDRVVNFVVCAPFGLGQPIINSTDFRLTTLRICVHAVVSTLTRVCQGYMGYSVLTWASVVVLGGFVSNLDYQQFRRASVLLLVQAVQFFSSTRWMMLFTCVSVRYRDPYTKFIYFYFSLSLFLYVTSNFCIFFSFALSIRELRSYTIPGQTSLVYGSAIRNYYALTIINSSVTALGVWLSLQKFFLGRQSFFCSATLTN